MKEFLRKLKYLTVRRNISKGIHRCPECGHKAFIRKRVYTNRRRFFGINSEQKTYYRCDVCKCEWYILDNVKER